MRIESLAAELDFAAAQLEKELAGMSLDEIAPAMTDREIAPAMTDREIAELINRIAASHEDRATAHLAIRGILTFAASIHLTVGFAA